MKEIKKDWVKIGIVNGKDWLKSLPESTRNGLKGLEKFSKEDWGEWHKRVKEKERARVAFLNRKE